MNRKNLIALFVIAALSVLALPALSETPRPEERTCPVANLSEILAPAPLSLATLTCGFCSFSSCIGATEGAACTRPFGGAPGTCQISGKICGGGSRHCGCYAP